jgi:hypothetical protein
MTVDRRKDAISGNDGEEILSAFTALFMIVAVWMDASL